MRKPTKREEIKKKVTFQNPLLLFLTFILVWLYLSQPSTWKNKKEGVLEGCLLFYFLSFCWFSHSCLFWVIIFVQIWSCFLYFEDWNGFEFLKFWIILFFGLWEEFRFVVIRVQVQVWICRRNKFVFVGFSVEVTILKID